MYERFTDNARRVVRVAYGPRSQRRVEAPESEVVTALLAGGGYAGGRLRSLGIAAVESARPVERDELARGATDEARWHGVPYVGSEHVVIALARQPGSALPALGATPEALAEWLVTPPPMPSWPASLGLRLGKLWRRLI